MMSLEDVTCTSSNQFHYSRNKMLICNGTFVFLWLLLFLCNCNGSRPGHAASRHFKTPTNPSRNGSELTEEVHKNSYMFNSKPEPSQLLSPGKDTLECVMPWSCCDNEACQCQDILPQDIVKCSKNMTLSVLNSYCVTIDEESDIMEAGQCLYNYNYGLPYTDVPRNRSELNEFMCGTDSELHRTGMLCGRCQDGYYPRAYSFDMDCVPCPNGKSYWWKFLLAAFLPLTLFYAFILFFKVNVASSRFQGFLFYSQMISLPVMVRVFLSLCKKEIKISQTKVSLTAVRYLATLYGIWNLDFFRSMNLDICLGTDTVQTLALDLLVGVYPLLLMLMSYILIELYDRNFKPLVVIWKPFRRLFGLFRDNWDLRTSLIDAFATTILLTNVKFQSVSFDLLAPVKVYHLNSTGQWTYSIRLFYDATVPYFGPRHLPYAIMALAVLLLCAILPVLLFILYPCSCFQKLLNLFPVRWYILHTFVDSFYGCYKDGTQPGTRDCRWFAAILILSRFCIMFYGAYTYNTTYFPVAAMILTVVAILYITVQPFKDNVRHFTDINTSFILLLALWHVCVAGHAQSATKNQSLTVLFYAVIVLTAILPLVYISAIILHWMYSQRKFGTDVITRLHAWKSGYSVI